VLEARRRRGPGDDDFVDTLIQAHYSNGRALTNDEITGLLLTLIFAGQHTSAVMAAWNGILLMQRREHLDRVISEQEAVLGVEPITLASLRKLVVLERCIKEAERMYPPLVMLMRTILRDLEYHGRVLPAGDLAMVVPAVTHRLAQIFRDPQQYDPDRFAPGREEDRRTQFALIGFGGGKHRCIGSGFAYQQIKVIWSVLLRDFELELAAREHQPDYSTFVVGPRRPCMVRYRRKTASRTNGHAFAASAVAKACFTEEKHP
jgi:sterol 14-demethylase